MAIDQHPRENLLLEATAYTRRCLYCVPRAAHWTTPWNAAQGSADRLAGVEHEPTSYHDALLWEWLQPFQQRDAWELFVGLRADERWSIYFDEQPVMQFNRQHQLRRLFAGDNRYAANNGKLHRLDRSHLGGQVRLQQADLDEPNHAAVLNVCKLFLTEAVQALQSGRAQRMGEFPAGDTAWLPAFIQNLQRVASDFTIAASPAH